jgi:hypothetical protein
MRNANPVSPEVDGIKNTVHQLSTPQRRDMMPKKDSQNAYHQRHGEPHTKTENSKA